MKYKQFLLSKWIILTSSVYQWRFSRSKRFEAPTAKIYFSRTQKSFTYSISFLSFLLVDNLSIKSDNFVSSVWTRWRSLMFSEDKLLTSTFKASWERFKRPRECLKMESSLSLSSSDRVLRSPHTILIALSSPLSEIKFDVWINFSTSSSVKFGTQL